MKESIKFGEREELLITQSLGCKIRAEENVAWLYHLVVSATYCSSA